MQFDTEKYSALILLAKAIARGELNDVPKKQKGYMNDPAFMSALLSLSEKNIEDNALEYSESEAKLIYIEKLRIKSKEKVLWQVASIAASILVIIALSIFVPHVTRLKNQLTSQNLVHSKSDSLLAQQLNQERLQVDSLDAILAQLERSKSGEFTLNAPKNFRIISFDQPITLGSGMNWGFNVPPRLFYNVGETLNFSLFTSIKEMKLIIRDNNLKEIINRAFLNTNNLIKFSYPLNETGLFIYEIYDVKEGETFMFQGALFVLKTRQ